MAEMTLSHEYSDISGDPVYEYSETINSGTTGNYIILPDGAGKMQVWEVALILSAGQSGKVQYTISQKSSIVAGAANWFDWGAGTVTVSTNTALENVTGIRGISSSGNIKIEVRTS